MLSKCCLARTSVGTIIAPWYPLNAALIRANVATIVFPEPTSPCISLFITLEPDISFSISFHVLSCAFVSLYGKSFIIVEITSELFITNLFSLSLSLSLNFLSEYVKSKNSLKIILSFACFNSILFLGKWICIYALFISSRPLSLSTASGIYSLTGNSTLIACTTAFVTIFSFKPETRG